MADMEEVWEDLAAKASSQEGYFVMSESGTSVTAVDCGGRSIRGEEACRSQRFGIVEGILWVVGSLCPMGSEPEEEAIGRKYLTWVADHVGKDLRYAG